MKLLLIFLLVFLSAWAKPSFPSPRTSYSKSSNWILSSQVPTPGWPNTPELVLWPPSIGSPSIADIPTAWRTDGTPGLSSVSTIWSQPKGSTDEEQTTPARSRIALSSQTKKTSTAWSTWIPNLLTILTLASMSTWQKKDSPKPPASTSSGALKKNWLLVAALFALPINALDPDEATWETNGRLTAAMTFVALPFALALSTGGLRSLAKWWQQKGNPEIEPPLGKDERDILTFSLNVLERSLETRYLRKKDEAVPAFLERLAQIPYRVVKETDDLEVRNQAIKSITILYQLLGQGIEQLETLKTKLDQREEQVAALGTRVSEYENASRVLSPDGLSIIRPNLLGTKIKELQRAADLSPLLSLLPDDPGGLDTPFKMKEAIHQAARVSLKQLWDAIPEKFRTEPWKNIPDITKVVGQLANALNRQTRAMSISPGQPSSQVTQEIWDDLPAHWKDPLRPPRDTDDLLETIRPWYEGCNHPSDLARHLYFDASTPWEDSTREVDRLINQGPTTSFAPAATTSDPLFKISDVPTFTRRSEYVSYRATLRRFFDSITEPALHQYGVALNRIITAWTAEEIRRTAANWDVTGILMTPPPHNRQRTWEEVKTSFLEACDNKFLELTVAQEAIKSFIGTRPKKDQKPMDFLLDFEAATEHRETAAHIFGLPSLLPQEVIGQLLRVIPSPVRDQLRLVLSSQNPPRMPENMTYNEIRLPLINVWTYMPQPAAPRASSHNVAGNRTQNPRNLPGAADQVQTRSCGLRSSYATSPAVPPHLQGPLYFKPGATPEQNNAARGRNEAAVRGNICEACRRPQNQHPAGSTFKAVQPWRTPPGRTNALPAPSGRLALPAPPAPSVAPSEEVD